MLARKEDEVLSEFNEFTYIISHDLGAPLRHIREFTHLLLETLQADLSEEQKEFKFYIESAVIQIEQMQEALLTYSRVRTHAEDPVLISMKDLAEEVCKGYVQEQDMNFNIHDLPDICADKKQVGYVLQALVDNACKFRRPNEPGFVEVGAITRGDMVEFFVKDNGVGIDAKLCDVVFTLFRKAHTNREIGGVGAGLTICKKIIERHGGRMWIESALGEGTRVYFTLPDVPAIA